MAWWKALLVNVVVLPSVAAFTVIALRAWFDRRQELVWPIALATVTAYKQGPGFKGRSATYLVGHYTSPNLTSSEFTVKWDLSDMGTGAWVPPANVPPIGSSIRVHVDPQNPSVVALAEGPRVPTTFGTLSQIVLIDVVAIAGMVTVWFI